MYHARKISFSTAAYMAGLDFDGVNTRLKEHFSQGYIFDDKNVLDDIETVTKL
ncbi:MAG: hypothetical protein NTY69_10310 [Methylococcales bacterium]|nr:hypothetical protein [Methylococcales bacterium]